MFKWNYLHTSLLVKLYQDLCIIYDIKVILIVLKLYYDFQLLFYYENHCSTMKTNNYPTIQIIVVRNSIESEYGNGYIIKTVFFDVSYQEIEKKFKYFCFLLDFKSFIK